MKPCLCLAASLALSGMVACSSPGSPPSQPLSDAAATLGADMATDGWGSDHASDAANGESQDADGGGSLVDNAGGDAATGNDEQACSDYAASVCGNVQSCLPFYLQLTYGNLTSCTARKKAPCVSALAAHGSGATAAAVEACARALVTVSCADYLSNNLPSVCNIQGSVATGGACGSDWQCAGTAGYCDISATASCGVCSARSGVGGNCLSDNDCLAGLACLSSAPKPICAARGSEGSPCDPTHPCQATMVCAGAACALQPLVGAACQGSPGDVSSCDSYSAAHGLYCDGTHCVQGAIATVGQTCLSPPKGVTFCSGNVNCVATSFTGPATCPAPIADGAPCAAPGGGECQAPALCVGGTCRLPDPSSCN
jgi:hypothetical protein